MSHARALSVCIALSCLLAACSAHSSVVPSRATLEETQSIASTLSTQTLYVTSEAAGGPVVTEYATTANGNVTPLRAIFDRTYDGFGPDGVAVDSSGNIYVTYTNACVVAVYAALANGFSRPIRLISGSNTRLCFMDGPVDSVALDSLNNIYVGNAYSQAVLVFHSGATGNVAPIRRFGMNTVALDGIIVSPTGKAYFADDAQPADVQVYPANAGTTTRALQYIAGSRTGILYQPSGVALDSAGNIYVANGDENSIVVFAPAANGNALPIRTIKGLNTKLSSPQGLALDKNGNMYVSNFNTNSITVYAAGASGNVAPIRTIRGTATKITQPLLITIR